MRAITIFLVMCVTLQGCSYSNFRTHKVEYTPSEYVTNDTGAATASLIDMGYDIKRATYEVVETEIETVYMNEYPRTVEFQTWIKVFTQAGRIKAYCTQREMYSSDRGRVIENWRFYKCTSPVILKRIDRTLDDLTRRLEKGL